MSELEKNLVGFRRRVRWLRAWLGMAIGGMAGALVSLIMSALDYFRVAYSSWLFLAIPVAVGLVAGAFIGFFRRVKVNDLADSIDRRATLQNRLGTAAEEADDDMREIQRADAMAHLQTLKPAAVFPVRVSRWHGGTVLVSILAASLFILGNTPMFLNDKDKQDRKALKEAAKTIERVTKPILERKPDETLEDAKKIAKQMDELKREMEKGRIPKEEAMQKANKLAEEAQKLAKQDAQQSDMQMQTAEQQLEKIAQDDALKQLGLSEKDFKEGELEKARNMTEEEREQMKKDTEDMLKNMQSQLGMQSKDGQKSDSSNKDSQNNDSKSDQQRMEDMQKQMEQIQKQLDSGRDAKGNKLSDEQKKAMEELMKQLQEMMKDLKISQAIQDFMKKLQSMKEFQEIQKLLQELAKLNQQNQQGQDGQQPQEIPKLSEQDLADMKQKLKDAMKAMEDKIKQMTDSDIKKMLEDYKKMLEDALKNGLEACNCMGMMPGLGGLLPGLGMGMSPGMGGMPAPGQSPGGPHSWGASGPGQDGFYENRGQVPLTDKPTDSNAKTVPVGTSGDRQKNGEESYVEIKGPVKPGERSKTPYFKVLPKYKKQAEDALDKDRIPKQHQKRVKDYFDSLTRGGK